MDDDVARRVLEELGSALSSRNISAAAALFLENGMWRDLVSFTCNIFTAVGQKEIEGLIEQAVVDCKPSNFVLESSNPGEGGTVEGWFHFKCALGLGKGLVRVSGGKIFTLLTALFELHDHKPKINSLRPMGVVHHYSKSVASSSSSASPSVLIIGGGQAGLALAARLKVLSVPTIVVDKYGRPGDQWRNRYAELVLHDPVWFDHMPHLPFPDCWPVFTPKDKMAQWLEFYTSAMELEYWGNTECKSASYDEENRQWTVELFRNGKENIVMHPKIVVCAMGIFGAPKIPTISGMDSFKGMWHHSSKHPGGSGFAGKKCVVVGANNSAHDVCAGLWAAGAASVTMIQRSSSTVIRSDPLMKSFAPLYSQEAVEKGMTTEKADLYFSSVPFPLLPHVQKPFYDNIAIEDAEFYSALNKVGFRHNFGADGTGLFMSYLRYGGGYYIDVGASELVVKGEIKVKNGQVSHITSHSVVMEDGTDLPADLIVFATGYSTIDTVVESIFGQKVASAVGKVWGLGSGVPGDPGPTQSELRNMWKPTAQEGLFFHGGNLMLSRYYSQFLALQIKIKLENISGAKFFDGTKK